MKTFDIWAEGYAATGNRSGATLMGSARGENFKGACDAYAAMNPRFAAYYDPERLTHWGCRLFNNEHDARKAFG